MDLALLHPEYIRELANHHVSGHLKVAPEHTSAEVLKIMRKPPKEVYEKFSHLFNTYSKNAGKIQFIIPYLIASHPGACIEHELDVALFLKKKGLRPHQIQDFLPSPMDIATSIYHTGKDPFSGKSVYSVKGEREKRIHRAIIQYYKKENQTKLRQILKRLTTKKYDELLLPPR
jgi:radical SAM superfamily enzyme YgiQ (UPF0313 family)